MGSFPSFSAGPDGEIDPITGAPLSPFSAGATPPNFSPEGPGLEVEPLTGTLLSPNFPAEAGPPGEINLLTGAPLITTPSVPSILTGVPGEVDAPTISPKKLPTPEKAAIAEAASAEVEQKKRRRRGFPQTILTGPQGLLNAPVTRKTLLG